MVKSKGGKKAGKRAIGLKIDTALANGDTCRVAKSKGGNTGKKGKKAGKKVDEKTGKKVDEKAGKKVDKKTDEKAGNKVDKKADKKARKKANRKARILRKRSAAQKVDKLLPKSDAGLDWNDVFVRLFGTVE